MKTKEIISHKPGYPEAWICICGNHPVADGFFPCDEKGNEVAPDFDWKGLYFCDNCGRIINQKTLEVIGRKLIPNSIANIQ